MMGSCFNRRAVKVEARLPQSGYLCSQVTAEFRVTANTANKALVVEN